MRRWINNCRNCNALMNEFNAVFCSYQCKETYKKNQHKLTDINTGNFKLRESKKRRKELAKKRSTTSKPRNPDKMSRRKYYANSGAFYYSREWQIVRYLAIKRYGKKCMCCGHECEKIHVDHIKPRSRFPKLALCITNLQILCETCNMGKGAWDQTDWRDTLSGAERKKHEYEKTKTDQTNLRTN